MGPMTFNELMVYFAFATIVLFGVPFAGKNMFS
jgi:hypothetical protein